MKAHFCAAIALACTIGSANAAITVDRTSWKATLSGLDNQLTNFQTYSDGGLGQKIDFWFELADGLSVPEVSLFLDAVEGVSTWAQPSFAVRWTFGYTDGYSNGGIAFSQSTVSLNYAGTNYQTTSVTPFLQGLNWASPAALPLAGDTVTWTDLYFGGGKGLNPSPDATCASFSCMTPFTTKGTLRLEVFIHGVPEPESIAMSVAGLAIIGMFAQRRRGATNSRG